jgi:hypothetical protein
VNHTIDSAGFIVEHRKFKEACAQYEKVKSSVCVDDTGSPRQPRDFLETRLRSVSNVTQNQRDRALHERPDVRLRPSLAQAVAAKAKIGPKRGQRSTIARRICGYGLAHADDNHDYRQHRASAGRFAGPDGPMIAHNFFAAFTRVR